MSLEVAARFYAASDFDSGSPHSFRNSVESSSPEPRKPRVLVVDDEKRVADTVSEILNASSFEAVAAYDGWSALAAAARFRPDYLLSDVLMPRMNGAELAIAIRETSPATKILLFSGQVGISDIIAKAQQRGFEFDLLAKPIHPVRLIERLKQL